MAGHILTAAEDVMIYLYILQVCTDHGYFVTSVSQHQELRQVQRQLTEQVNCLCNAIKQERLTILVGHTHPKTPKLGWMCQKK